MIGIGMTMTDNSCEVKRSMTGMVKANGERLNGMKLKGVNRNEGKSEEERRKRVKRIENERKRETTYD